MTRINIIDPSELYDQHLIAERTEILQLCGSFRRSLASKRGVEPSRLPNKYTLNRGHVLFFYDKGQYLHNRFRAVTREMIKRGFQPDQSIQFPKHLWPKHLYNDWSPSSEDEAVIRFRIAQKLAMKPDWYKKTPVKTHVIAWKRQP